MANSSSSVVVENVTSIVNAIAFETSTLVNNITAGSMFPIGSSDVHNASSGILQEPFVPDDDGTQNKPELKYFSTVIIIFMGLTILIVPVFCFVGFVCARARIFKTVREAAGKGWGFADAGVPYSEFGSEDQKPSNSNASCDVKILVADDNSVPSSSNLGDPIRTFGGSRLGSGRKNTRGSFMNTPIGEEEDDDISSLPATFVRDNPA